MYTFYMQFKCQKKVHYVLNKSAKIYIFKHFLIYTLKIYFFYIRKYQINKA